jgi:hypothetical protein
MKRLVLILTVSLAGMYGFSQECGHYIDLLGKGIFEQSMASIEISDADQVDFIVAEAIYKSYDPAVKPSQVKFSFDEEEILADPETVPINGFQNEGVITSVFRATFEGSAAKVDLDILENVPQFYSLALYVFRRDGTIVSTMNGKLYHVYKNEDAAEEVADEPLVIDIPVHVADHPRDLTLRFGITELNNDERWAIFRFEADGQEVSLEVQAWDPDEETRSFTIREVTFENVPGDVDNITMTMLSNDTGGDSFIAGIVLLDMPCEYEEHEMYCTYTQGFYGNEGGRTCMGETTPELLERLLDEDLVMGVNGNTFTIGTGNIDCVLDILPGGGPSKALQGEASCSDLAGVETNKQGRLKNSLLAQGITLALNLRNSPGLLSFPVDGTMFVTVRPIDCMDPEAGGSGPESTHSFKQEIADFLGEGATIGDLMDLVNRALAGEDISPLSLSQVSDAATSVNEAFDECMIVLGEAVNDEPGNDVGEIEEGGTEEGSEAEGISNEESDKDDESATNGTTGISDNVSNTLGLYPNPVMDRFFISLPVKVESVKAASIYSITGTLIKHITDQVASGSKEDIGIDAGELLPGIYFIRVDTDAGTFLQRFGVQ